MNSILISSSTFRSMTSVLNSGRGYIVACVCLLIIAGGLRFYNLSGHVFRLDEIKAALYSRGDISEVVHDTRYGNSSPILYPIALWGVQKVARTEFSARVVPAAASVLTVGALLLMMPRVGVPRMAAFLAALLAALSAAAVVHAQDAREYSVDALAAALIIAGLLGYLRDGKKALLCAALAAGPLLQYGLVLFGAAALVAAAAAPAAFYQPPIFRDGRLDAAAIWEWLTRRRGLLLPLALFVAACAISWTLTARYQWVEGGHGGTWHLADQYYRGGFDGAAIAGFAIGQTWDMLSYHMPTAIACAALVGFGALVLIWARRRRRVNGLALLALLAVGAGICAALLEAYPWGGVRQNLYMGPIVFLAAGSAFHSAAAALSALLRRAWVGPALGVAAACAIAVGGSAAVYQSWELISDSDASMKQIVEALEELEREGDAVYVSRVKDLRLKFYKAASPDNYFYGNVGCWVPVSAGCVPEMLDEMFRVFDKPRRIWLVHNESISLPDEMAAYSQEVTVEEIPFDGWTTLHLITGYEEVAANIRKKWFVDAPADTIIGESTYNIHLHEGALYYVKQPCVAADTEGSFFMNVFPEDAADLPEQLRQYGYETINSYSDFERDGLRDSDKCVKRQRLPDYPVGRLQAGQVLDGAVVWEVDIPFGRIERFRMYDDIVSVPPNAAAGYDIYLHDEAIYYAKPSCVDADTEAAFFLYIYPVDAADMSAQRRGYGYEAVNFDFRDYGGRDADRCLVWFDLPDYSINHIHTGQYVYPDGPVIWETDFPFSPKARLDVYDEVVSDAPVAAGGYDVYLQDGALYYAKRPCALADTEARFFLYVFPEDAAYLPAHRRQRGYYAFNFEFHDYGANADGRCLIRRALPSYPIEHIHTGQFVHPDGPVVWETDFPFDR